MAAQPVFQVTARIRATMRAEVSAAVTRASMTWLPGVLISYRMYSTENERRSSAVVLEKRKGKVKKCALALESSLIVPGVDIGLFSTSLSPQERLDRCRCGQKKCSNVASALYPAKPLCSLPLSN